ncbi:hypothetical protein TeGR_g14738 [Tetraparma gracilis]|uniref:Pre-mRNA-splicing factor 18 n=1 Tax=Tetraparma gracilis TaxID=2962635 RepID=A0ABQ6N657_9STRA|nr:hypothetical protein TeGR_g14738 [Tetraparma gracilis]
MRSADKKGIAAAGADEFNLGSDIVLSKEKTGGFSKEYVIGGEEIYDADFRQGAAAEEEKRKKEEEEVEEDFLADNEDDCKMVYSFFRGLLRRWEKELLARAPSEARTSKGKTDTNTCRQTVDYIAPLFRMLKARTIDPGQLTGIAAMVRFCKEGEFVRANDAYIDIAIGRAAWPIGVTMVGIHARAGRAKVEENKVAHVMNSDKQRKYLTSVKRLMNYYQESRDDIAPSKKVT